MKKIKIKGVHRKMQFLGGVHEKTIYRERLQNGGTKKEGLLEQFADLGRPAGAHLAGGGGEGSRGSGPLSFFDTVQIVPSNS